MLYKHYKTLFSFKISKILFILTFTFLFLTEKEAVNAVEIQLKSLELASIGTVRDNTFVLESSAQARIAFLGGHKFGGNIEFGLRELNMENLLVQNSYLPLSLTKLSFTAFRPGGAPLDITWFFGLGDAFCNGDSFSTWFEDAPIGTDYRGIQYFPQGINDNTSYQYDGIHQIQGTGLELAIRPSKNIITAIYLYQDSDFARAENDLTGGDELNLDLGFWSGDIRFLFNSQHLKIEAFAGLSLPSYPWATWRGGLLTYVSTPIGADFLFQIGIPRWDSNRSIGVDNFFFLIEPRIRLGITAIQITFFYHPYYYRQAITDRQAQMDLNTRFTIGRIDTHQKEGGLEASIYFRGDGNVDGPISISINPFFSMLYSGVRWDVKTMIDPLGFNDLPQNIRLYLGLRTAF